MSSPVWFGVITLFPEMLQSLKWGITGRALKKKQILLQCFNPRDYTEDKHQTVDAKPYGGGPGMVMMAEPLIAAIQAAKHHAPHPPLIIFLSPQGKLFNQALAEHTLSQERSFIFIAGRYEGIDQRVIDLMVNEEWSLGDYILSGGELPAMAMIDALTRLLPDVVHDHNSIKEDSITRGCLKYPQYTRPESVEDLLVPDVLLSGNHQLIAEWRQKMAYQTTLKKRPDLLQKKRDVDC